MTARPWAAGYRRAKPGFASLTPLAAGSGARGAGPYSNTVLHAARLAPLPATAQEHA
jgi:hypothetical protein